MDFWASFWPNFASTVAGVILGLPVALWLNRAASSASEKDRKALEAETLSHGLRAVRAALEHNEPRLETMMNSLAADKALFELDLDTAAWGVARDQIIPYLRDPELERRLALHFSRLDTVSRLSAMYLELAAGVSSALGTSLRTRASLKEFLLARCAALQSEGKELLIATKPTAATERAA